MKSLDDMTEPELKALFVTCCDRIKATLPPGTAFILLASPFGRGGVAHYAGNAQRPDAAKWMLETVERWSRGDYVTRVGP